MFRRLFSKKASILIFSLWILMLLTIFATTIGLTVRQRMTLLSRLEDRSRLHYLSEAGIKLAIAAIRSDMMNDPFGLSARSKVQRFNNPELFAKLSFEEGQSFVGFPLSENSVKGKYQYGVVDEERKININVARRATLARLIELLTNEPQENIKLIVESIIDWREIGDSKLLGFSSDEYYSNLPHPYVKKNAPLELLDELKLIQGMDEKIFTKLEPFITIYGDGLVNINTAPIEVLIALGLDENIAHKLILARNGADGIDSTADDYIFINPFDVTRNVQNLIELEREELIQIDFLNGAGKIKTSSFYFSIRSEGMLNHRNEISRIACIYNAKDNIIEYWRENN